MRTNAAAVALLLLTGCQFLDHETQVRLEPSGAVTCAGELSVRIISDAGGDVRLLLDGEELPERPRLREPYRLTLDRPNGTYRLQARVHDGGISVDSASTFVTVARPLPSPVTWSPASPHYRTGGPFHASVTFDAELAAARGFTATGPLASGGAGTLPVTVEVAGSRVDLTVIGAGALDVAPLAISGTVCDQHGNCGPFQMAWDAPTLTGEEGPIWTRQWPWVTWVRGDVILAAATAEHWALDLPALDLLVDGAKRGSLAPSGSLALDTTTLADGVHELLLDAPGVIPAPPVTIQVDNTAPTATCSPSTTRPDDLGWLVGVVVTFSEPINWGVPPAPDWTETTFLRFWSWRPAGLPDTFVPDVSTAFDRAGNAAALAGSCTFELPLWREPWPALLSADTLASELAVTGLTAAIFEQPDEVSLAVRDASDGSIRSFAGSGGPAAPSLAEGPVLSVDAASGLTGGGTGGGLSWMEEAATEDRVVVWTPAGGRTVVATAPSIASVASTLFAGTGAAWIEAQAGGVRALRYRWLGVPGKPELGAGSSPPGQAIDAAVSGPTLAFTEVTSGGPAQLRTQEYNPYLESLGAASASHNRDTAQAATHPVVSSTALAWEEGGDVVVRVRGPSGGPFESIRENLDSAPNVDARWPRIAEPCVVFIEREAGTDRFEVRVSEGYGWRAWPSLATDGQVAAYAVFPGTDRNAPLTIVWIDGDGKAHLRILQQT